MSDTIITHLTLDSLRDVLQQTGYRVEPLTDPVANIAYLRSATAGLTFDVRPGNRLVGADHNFVDAAFVAILQVQGELPLDLVNRWNANRRFARLQLSAPFLVLSLDVTVAGGVTQNHLRAHVELWDYLIQQLIAYLREELPKLANTNTANTSAANTGTANSGATLNGSQPVSPEHIPAAETTFTGAA